MSFTTDPVAKKRHRRQYKSWAYVPSDPVVSRSCAILYQAWNCAPKRNQVFSASLISRVGPSIATPGIGAPSGGGLAGAVSGDSGFPVCCPAGGDPVCEDPVLPVCADAAAAASMAITDADQGALLAFKIVLMNSSLRR